MFLFQLLIDTHHPIIVDINLIFDMNMENIIQDGINLLSIIVVVYIAKRMKIKNKPT